MNVKTYFVGFKEKEKKEIDLKKKGKKGHLGGGYEQEGKGKEENERKMRKLKN